VCAAMRLASRAFKMMLLKYNKDENVVRQCVQQ
jgi:hypothetical protein